MAEGSNREARTFHVDTRFQKLARRPGGISRERALENAQAQIEENKPDFETWLDGELKALVAVVAKVEAGTAEPHWAEAVSSHCRQLRDIGSTIGYPLLTFIASNLCDILENPNKGVDINLETINCHVDALQLARQARYRNMRPDQLPELTGGLRRVAEFLRVSPDDVRIAPDGETK
jgi:hypothetical protein